MPAQTLTATAPLPALLPAVLLLVLTFAVWFDVREGRIPNWLTAGGAMVAMVLRGSVGAEALWAGSLGAALGMGLGISLFAAGALGAGDGKLLVSVGSILGFETFLRCLPLVGGFGGLLAIAVTIRRGTFLATVLRFRELLFFMVSFGRIGERRTLAMPGSVTVPYGVAVAAGATMAWLAWGLAS